MTLGSRSTVFARASALIAVAAACLSSLGGGRVAAMQERRTVNAVTGAASSPAVVAGGLVFVSALDGLGDGSSRDGNVGEQAKVVLERLGRVLEAAGSSLAQAVSISVYLKQASDFEAMNGVYRGFFPDAPPTRTTVVTSLPPRVLVSISAVAALKGQPREVLHPAGWMKSPRPYSYIVRAGNLVFLSGLVSRRGTDDQPVSGPVATQVKTILDNAAVLLRTARLTLGDVVAARVFIVDETTFTDMNDEYRKYFPADPPARATAVAGLVGASSLVEITLIAAAEGRQSLGPSVSPSLPLSPAVRAGRFTFLSGVLGNTDQNQSDIAQQTREVFDRTRRTLETAGLSFGDVVDNLVYVTDLTRTAAVDQVTMQFFPADAPARSLVGTRLVARTGLVEMMMTAYK